MSQIILQGLSIPELKKLLSEVVEEKLGQFPKVEKPKSKEVYLSRFEVAELLKISLPTLNEWSKLGTLQSYRIGNRILYKAQEVEASLSTVKNLKYKGVIMAHKNDYSVIAFLSTGEVKKWAYVRSLKDFAKLLDEKHSEWMYMNVYERRTRKYLKRFYKGNILPDFL